MQVLGYLEACPGIAVRPEAGGESQAALAGYIDALHHDWRAACKAAAAAALRGIRDINRRGQEEKRQRRNPSP